MWLGWQRALLAPVKSWAASLTLNKLNADVCVYNPSTWEVEEGQKFWVIHSHTSKFKASFGYIVREQKSQVC